MSQCTVVVSDPEDTEFTLQVEYEAHEGCPDHFDPWTGWSPGEPAGIEIDESTIRCTEITVYCGKYGFSMDPGMNDGTLGELRAGEYCWGRWKDDITERVIDAANAAAEESYE